MNTLLLMLHGWGLHGGIWEAAPPVTRRRLLALDLPGHGHGPPPPQDYTLDTLAGHCLSFLQPGAVIVGWSLGGLVALELARRNPQEVAGLVLVGSTPRFTTSPDWPHGLADEQLAEFAAALAQDRAATLQRFLALHFQDCPDGRAGLRRLRAIAQSAPAPHPRALAGGLDILRHADLRDVLAAIHCPVLLVHGERDAIVPAAAARALAAALPAASLHLIPEAGHAPFLSHGAHFNTLLQTFCHGLA